MIPDIDTGSIQLSDRKYIDEALRSDRLQFADHILIDVDYDGKFYCDCVFGGDLNDVIFKAGDNFRAIVTDVFGKEYLADLDI